MNLPNKHYYQNDYHPVYLAVFLWESCPTVSLSPPPFIIGSITDTLDGRIARKHNLITNFGKLADLADKMLTTAALLVFMKLGLCSIWVIMIVLAREFAVTSVRLVASSQGVVIPANNWGKIKTVSQMVFSILIMILGGFNELNMLPEAFNFPLVSNILLWITAVLTIISGGTYLWESRNLIDYSK